jgi:hypothetical protein
MLLYKNGKGRGELSYILPLVARPQQDNYPSSPLKTIFRQFHTSPILIT